jgi:hypothetical protein
MSLRFGFVNRFEVEFRFWDLCLSCVCDFILRFVVTTLHTFKREIRSDSDSESHIIIYLLGVWCVSKLDFMIISLWVTWKSNEKHSSKRVQWNFETHLLQAAYFMSCDQFLINRNHHVTRIFIDQFVQYKANIMWSQSHENEKMRSAVTKQM